MPWNRLDPQRHLVRGHDRLSTVGGSSCLPHPPGSVGRACWQKMQASRRPLSAMWLRLSRQHQRHLPGMWDRHCEPDTCPSLRFTATPARPHRTPPRNVAPLIERDGCSVVPTRSERNEARRSAVPVRAGSIFRPTALIRPRSTYAATGVPKDGRCWLVVELVSICWQFNKRKQSRRGGTVLGPATS